MACIWNAFISPYLWVPGVVGDGDFEGIQDGHDPWRCFVQDISHTSLQQVGLHGDLGNGYSHLQ